MANLILNGTFRADLNNWTLDAGAGVIWQGSDGYESIGCAQFGYPAAGTAGFYQAVTTPASTAADVLLRLRYAGKLTGTVDVPLHVQVNKHGAATVYYEVTIPITEYPERWFVREITFRAPQNTSIDVRFEVAHSVLTQYWRLDDVEVESAAILSKSCADFTLDLRKRRDDLGCLKHPEQRYQELVRRAIREAPMCLWEPAVDETLHTDEEKYEYALTALTAITQPAQVQGVWVQDSYTDELWHELGNWWIKQSGTALSLVLDRLPVEDDLHIRLEYLVQPAELDCTDRTAVTTLDREWVLAKTMTLLLMEAYGTGEDPNLIAQQLQMWDMARQARELLVGRRQPSRPYRHTDWRQYR